MRALPWGPQSLGMRSKHAPDRPRCPARGPAALGPSCRTTAAAPAPGLCHQRRLLGRPTPVLPGPQSQGLTLLPCGVGMRPHLHAHTHVCTHKTPVHAHAHTHLCIHRNTCVRHTYNTCAHMHTCTDMIHIHTCTHIHTCAHAHVCAHTAHTHLCIQNTWTHLCTTAHEHTSAHTYTSAHALTYTRTHLCTHKAHIQTCKLSWGVRGPISCPRNLLTFTLGRGSSVSGCKGFPGFIWILRT